LSSEKLKFFCFFLPPDNKAEKTHILTGFLWDGQQIKNFVFGGLLHNRYLTQTAPARLR